MLSNFSHETQKKLNKDGSLDASILFSMEDNKATLDQSLVVLKELEISMTCIKSRPNLINPNTCDVFADIGTKDHHLASKLIDYLISKATNIKSMESFPSSDNEILKNIPWFPRKKSDLDTFAEKVLGLEELDSHHPGAQDLNYIQRRDEITSLAKAYKTGQPLPNIKYTDLEIKTWGQVYRQTTALFEKHACREYLDAFSLLKKKCDLDDSNIPQIEDISKFLKECTGFTLRPVMGLLTSRDFLNSLAFRVFHCTQYVRHHSEPFFSPEPDVCHELLGHVPLFANPEFAAFSQEIGLASLGASDEAIERLATIYWFTIEYGLCKQGDELKVYGAGILSSYGEIQYAMSDKPEKRPFDPKVTAVTKYPIIKFQPVYYVAESFNDAKDKIHEFADSLSRPFHIRYDPYTESVKMLDSKEKLADYANSVKCDFKKLINTFDFLSI
ncbi:hypothetical protein K502DRAFT_312470 [Neoconidiobolus thromboides FSU 785]|nr:hypothetical protein K502DRAFT_312470 [Neoconidiobolus thromboides FSU 785]